MNKLRRKYNKYRTLKTICYFLGYPLLLAIVFLGSIAFLKGDAFQDTWYYGLLIVAVAWVAVIILQLVFSLFCKNKQGKAMFSLILSLVIVIGGAIALDVVGKNTIKKVQDDNKEYNVEIENYDYQVQYFIPLTSGKSGLVEEYNEEIGRFMRTYNVGLKSSCKGSTNADGSEIEYLGGTQNEKIFGINKTINFDYDKDVYLSKNEMYADGYIFGVQQALDILITYNEVQEQYKAEGKDADEELFKAIQQASSSSEWSQYKNSEEYKAAYGSDGSAYDHSLTMEQVDKILGIIGNNVNALLSDLSFIIDNAVPSNIKSLLNIVDENLSVQTLVSTINSLTVEDILGIAFMVIPAEEDVQEVLIKALQPILEYASESTIALDFTSFDNFEDSLEEITVQELLTGLDYDKLSGAVESLGIDLSAYESLFDYGLTVDFIENIIYSLSLTSPLFNYQSPTTKPIYEFIEDETLKSYAYAKYYGSVHGANVGSVLIGDNLGHVAMGDTGYPSSKGFTLQELYQLRADMSYATTVYPMMAARRYMYSLGGLIALMMALCYHNSNKQDEIFDMIEAGGAR